MADPQPQKNDRKTSERTAMPRIAPRSALTAIAPASTPANHLGPYRLKRVLRHDLRGAVWLAEDARVGETVALRTFPASQPGTEALLARLAHEAPLLKSLDHPGISGIHDSVIIDEVAVIATRFVEGQTLAERLASDVERATPEDVSRLFERVARALHAVHEVGVAHGDLKPGNVMITSDGDPVILDFGLIPEFDDEAALTRGEAWFGTPAYVAPETLECEESPRNPRVDIWSLGATLFEALTLRPPFAAPTRGQLTAAIREVDPELPSHFAPNVGGDLDFVVMTCLRKAADDRYATALDLAEDLKRAREGSTILARRPSLSTRLRRWVRRHPAPAGLMGAALFLTPALSVILAFIAATTSAVESDRDARRARAFEGHLEGGLDQLHGDDDGEAVRAFSQALAIHPGSLVAEAGRALALLEQGRLPEALIRLDLAREPQVLDQVRAEVLDALGRADDAANLRRGLAAPVAPVETFIAGMVEMSRGNRGEEPAFARAARSLGMAVATRPSAPQRSWHLAWLRAVARGGSKAERDRAVHVTGQLWPDDARMWRAASRAVIDHDPEQARRLCERYLEQDPGNPTVLDRLARALAATGEHERARLLALDLLENAPELPGPLATLAAIDIEAGHIQKARAWHERALRRFGASLERNLSMATLLMSTRSPNDLRRAEGLLRDADRMAPDIRVRLRLAACCRSLGRIEDAIECYRRAANLQSGDAQPWTELFALHNQAGRYAEALDAARRAYVYSEPGGEERDLLQARIEATRRRLDDARRLDTILSETGHAEDSDDVAALLTVAQPRGPEAVAALWSAVRRSEAVSGMEGDVLRSAFIFATASAAGSGQHRPGPWLDTLLIELRKQHAAARALPESERRSALASLLDERRMGALLRPEFFAGDDVRRISLKRFFDEVRRDLGPAR